MRAIGRNLALALIVATLFLQDALARPYDPSLHFKTLETPHFLIHFHEEEEALARRAGTLAEAAHAKLSPLLGHVPQEKTHIILVDVEDSANGWATALPYNTIELRAAPPDSRSALHQADDWLWNLIVHEYTHVLHLDSIKGPSRLLNFVFGKSLSPNSAWPRWFVEGLGVWAESELSTGGRLRSSLFELEFRPQLLDGEPLSLQRLSHLPLDYPRLGSRYSYGGRFVDFIARKFGSEALRGFVQTNARSWVPYFLDTIAEQHTGLDFDTLYSAWLAEELEQARLDSQDAIDSTIRLTFHGETVRTPRASPDGKTLWSLVLDADSRPSLRAFDLETLLERRVADLNGDGGLTVLPDGRILVSQPEITGSHRTSDDLFLFEPHQSRLRRLTHGARLSEPDASTDGRILAIERPGPGRTRLVLFDSVRTLDAPRVLYEGSSTVASPRFSPDGTRLVFLEKRHGAFDMRLLDLSTMQARWLTNDSSQDINPAFDEGGRIHFASDRSGVFDLYVLDPESEVLIRRTRVRDGAFEPLSLGTRSFFVQASAQGFDLAELVEPLAETSPPPRPPVDEPEHGEPAPEWSIRPYDALDTLYPASRLPLLGSDARGTTIGLSLAGGDVLSKWRWSLSGWWGLSSQQPGFSLTLQTDVLFPTLTFHASRSLSLVPGVPNASEAVTNASVSSLWSFRRWNSVTQLEAGWNVTSLSPRSTIDSAASTREGILSSPFLNIAWSNTRRFTRSISAEEGRRLSLALEGGGRLTGGDFSLLRVIGAWNEYIGLPAHHALALQFTAGASESSMGGRAAYVLGGLPMLPSTTALLSLQSPTRVIHGYPLGTAWGSAFVLANVEWRFPLAAPEWGFSTLPIQLRRLHGAVLADVGDAFDSESRPFTPRVGVGMELRAEVVLGYLLTADFRLGFGRGLSDGGVNQFWIATGRSF